MRFKQTDADVTSFDVVMGHYLAKMVGQKKLVKFLGRVTLRDAMDMGMVNAVIPHAELEDTMNGHKRY
jgi:naphthoate synthase